MNGLEQVEKENKQIASNITQLAGTEDDRLSVVTAVFIRLNNQMRLENIRDIRQDISYGAKDFKQPPERYVTSMDSIVKSYIQEANRFMRAYNDEFMNIQNTLKIAEERQKYYFFKIRELIVMKNICALAEKEESEYAGLDVQIKAYRKKLGIYEKIIMRCDEEFEACKLRREKDFKELFEIKQEQALAVVQKENFIRKVWKILQVRFKGYENFSKFFLQKHAAKINQMKQETISSYITKIKQNMNSFNGEVGELLENT